jgi:hypothetical protein
MSKKQQKEKAEAPEYTLVDFEHCPVSFPYPTPEEMAKDRRRVSMHNLAVACGWANENQAREVYKLAGRQMRVFRTTEEREADPWRYSICSSLDVECQGGMLDFYAPNPRLLFQQDSSSDFQHVFERHHLVPFNHGDIRVWLKPGTNLKRSYIDAFCVGGLNFRHNELEAAEIIAAMAEAAHMAYAVVPTKQVQVNPGYEAKDLAQVMEYLTFKGVPFEVQPFKPIHGFYLITASHAKHWRRWVW